MIDNTWDRLDEIEKRHKDDMTLISNFDLDTTAAIADRGYLFKSLEGIRKVIQVTRDDHAPDEPPLQVAQLIDEIEGAVMQAGADK